MALFRHYGDVYRSMEELPIATREGMFIYRLDQLDTTTFYPVLLEVFKRYRNAEYRQEFDQILLDLESYLVRRAICELTTKNYNDLVVRLTTSPLPALLRLCPRLPGFSLIHSEEIIEEG